MPDCTTMGIAGGAAVVGLWYILGLLKRIRNAGSVKDKVILLTGASSGLGEACAHVFYKAGARLIICARRKNELQRVKNQLMEFPVPGAQEPQILELDLTQFGLMNLRVEEALNFHGHVDILVNNAGVSYRGEAEMTSLDVDINVMNVNYFGQVALTKALLPFMIGRKAGQIVVVSSVQGKLPIPYRTSYSASKHALQAYFDSLRAEMAEHNIEVSMISPGYIKTNLSLNAVTGDGSIYGRMDQTTAEGMEPEFVARRILNAIIYKKEDVILAPITHKIAIFLRYLAPSVYYKIMSSRARKQRKEMKKRP